jgi:hypothetical protein
LSCAESRGEEAKRASISMPAEEEKEAEGGGVGARGLARTAGVCAGAAAVTAAGAAATGAGAVTAAAGRSLGISFTVADCVLTAVTASTVSFFTEGTVEGDGGAEVAEEDVGGAEVEAGAGGTFRSGFFTFAFPSTEIETQRRT